MTLGILTRVATDVARAAASVVPAWTADYIIGPKQQAFHDATARHVLYGGAAGGGKSRAMREDARLFCLNNPGVTVLFLRRTYRELRDTHIRKLRQEWPQGTFSFTKSEGIVKFPKGSIITFGHCQHDDDVFKYLGAEYDRVYFDELTTFSETIYDMVDSRVRSVLPGIVPQLKSGTNPGSIGHQWVKARWVTRTPPEHVNLDDLQFIQAKLEDHPLPEFRTQYRNTLMHLPEARRRAYLDGDWDVFEGQYFKGWRHEEHVIEGYAPPEHWPRCLCLDYGSTAPLAALWIARDPGADRLFVYREYYVAGKLLATNAKAVAERCGHEKYALRVADPSMAETTHEGTSLFDIARKHGLNLQPANNRRIAGWQLLQELMQTDGLPCPYTGRRARLLIDSSCVNLIRTMPALVHDTKNVEDLDTTGEDHAADALRYGCMAFFPQGIGGHGAAGGDLANVVAQRSYGRAA